MTLHKKPRYTFLLCAVEPSADLLGAELMRSLRKSCPDCAFIGCGGREMESEGLKSLFPIDAFSVIGPVGAVLALPAALKAVDQLVAAAAKVRPDAAIFIDSWSFSKIAAKNMRKILPTLPLIKYVAPQFWASRSRRLKDLVQIFSGVLTLFEFENDEIEKAGGRVKFVGNPLFKKAEQQKSDGIKFRQHYGINADTQLLAVLPGSRKAEVKRLRAPFGNALTLLKQRIPNLQCAVMAAPNVEEDVRKITDAWTVDVKHIEPRDKFEFFTQADVAIAASGTITTELAIMNTPMVVAYKVDPLTALWIRSVIETPYISLVNIAGGREIIPECLQEECTGPELASRLEALLEDASLRDGQRRDFKDVLPSLGVGDHSNTICPAEAIYAWIEQK